MVGGIAWNCLPHWHIMLSSRRLSIGVAFLIALIGVVPLVAWLEWFPRLLLLAGFGVGLLQEWRSYRPLPPRILNLLLVAIFCWYLLHYSLSNPVQPVVSMIVIMLAVRIGGEKTVRNLLQINLLALICLAARSLFDLSPIFLFWLALLLLLIPVSLVLLTFLDQDMQLRLQRRELVRVVLVALFMTIVTVPVMTVLFPLLPRTAFPLWNFMAVAVTGPTGVSDRVEPGITANATVSRTVAFRAEVAKQVQPPYWRVTVFNHLVGNRWTRSAVIPHENVQLHGQRVSQTIYPEPSSSRLLVGLDAPVEFGLPRVRTAADLVSELPRNLGKRVGYQVSSLTTGLLPIKTSIDRAFYLAVPPELPAPLRQLSARIRREGATDATRLALVERYFLNNGFRYSRQGLPTGKDALYQFLFVSKQGHCEFFAASFALLLRTVGVPARLVGGYLGGEYNELGGYYLVTDDHAHVWVEAYLDGQGWQRIDPSRFASNAALVWQDRPGKSLGRQLRLLLDALDYRWNQAVVTYDFERQLEQVHKAGRTLQRLERGVSLRKVAGPVLLVALLLVLFSLRRRLPFSWRNSRHERLLARFYRILKITYGTELSPEDKGLFELAATLDDPLVDRFVAIYAGSIYRDRQLATGELTELNQLLEEMRLHAKGGQVRP